MNEQELTQVAQEIEGDYLSNLNDLERYQTQGYYDSFYEDEFEYPSD